MLHLPSERLAEVADGDATPSELEHLATCLPCTRELDAHRRLLSLGALERLRIAPPLTDWGRVSAALRAEGVLVASSAPAPRAGASLLLHVRRAAAVVVLLGGGAILGRMSAGLGVMQAVALGTAVSQDSLGTRPAGGGGDVLPVVATNETFASPAAALAALERAQRAYESAAMYLASHDTSSSAEASEQYRTRLAALDRTAETMQQAMREAPEDPLINQYYLATMTAREQTLRRLGTVLPVGNRLGRF